MRKLLSGVMVLVFLWTSTVPGMTSGLPLGAGVGVLPEPGTAVSLSGNYKPPMLAGLKVYASQPMRMDFILDKGQEGQQDSQQSERLIKYFLASLTVPEQDLWVNLSPYEQDRIIPHEFGLTEMGRDLLAQDYLLKQITSSLMNPQDSYGKVFWSRIYDEAYKKYGTTDIPTDTFNKVWIVPEKAVVFERSQAAEGSSRPNEAVAYIVESKLKVMLETDYVAQSAVGEGPRALPSNGPASTSELSKQILREIIIPALEKEVNEGRNFAQLRQVYNSLILATWYKKKIKKSLLSEVYVDQKKVQGVQIDDPGISEGIWAQYVQAFKKGVVDIIREEKDELSGELIPRRYFSGGILITPELNYAQNVDAAKLPQDAQLVSARFDAAMKHAPSEYADWEALFKAIVNRQVEVSQLSGIQTMRAKFQLFVGRDILDIAKDLKERLGVDTLRVLEFGPGPVAPLLKLLQKEMGEEVEVLAVELGVEGDRLGDGVPVIAEDANQVLSRLLSSKEKFHLVFGIQFLPLVEMPFNFLQGVRGLLPVGGEAYFYMWRRPGGATFSAIEYNPESERRGLASSGYEASVSINKIDWAAPYPLVLSTDPGADDDKETLTYEMFVIKNKNAQGPVSFWPPPKNESNRDPWIFPDRSSHPAGDEYGDSAMQSVDVFKDKSFRLPAGFSIEKELFAVTDVLSGETAAREVFDQVRDDHAWKGPLDRWLTSKDIKTIGIFHGRDVVGVVIFHSSQAAEYSGGRLVETLRIDGLRVRKGETQIVQDVLLAKVIEEALANPALRHRAMIEVQLPSHEDFQDSFSLPAFKARSNGGMGRQFAYLSSSDGNLFYQDVVRNLKGATANSAMSVSAIDNPDKGGIDLNPMGLNLKMTGDDVVDMKFDLDPVQFAAFQSAPGVVPVIINVQPMDDLPGFLNLSK